MSLRQHVTSLKQNKIFTLNVLRQFLQRRLGASLVCIVLPSYQSLFNEHFHISINRSKRFTRLYLPLSLAGCVQRAGFSKISPRSKFLGLALNEQRTDCKVLNNSSMTVVVSHLYRPCHYPAPSPSPFAPHLSLTVGKRHPRFELGSRL